MCHMFEILKERTISPQAHICNILNNIRMMKWFATTHVVVNTISELEKSTTASTTTTNSPSFYTHKLPLPTDKYLIDTKPFKRSARGCREFRRLNPFLLHTGPESSRPPCKCNYIKSFASGHRFCDACNKDLGDARYAQEMRSLDIVKYSRSGKWPPWRDAQGVSPSRQATSHSCLISKTRCSRHGMHKIEYQRVSGGSRTQNGPRSYRRMYGHITVTWIGSNTSNFARPDLVMSGSRAELPWTPHFFFVVIHATPLYM